MPNPVLSDNRIRQTSSRRPSPIRGACSSLVLASIGICLSGVVGCASQNAVVSPSVSEPVLSKPGPDLSDPLAGVPDDFELEIKVFVGNKVSDQDLLERRDVHMVLFPDGTLHAAAGEQVIPGARPGLARTLLRGQVADAWALLGRLDLRDGGESPARPVRPAGRAEIVHIVELTANGERRRHVKRFVGSCQDSVTTTLVRSIGGLAWLTDAPPAGNDIIPLRYDFGPDPWERYRKSAQ